jgi:hypothetical protein
MSFPPHIQLKKEINMPSIPAKIIKAAAIQAS